MSIETSREAFEPYTGSHDSDYEYGSIDDFSVPEPVAEQTGIEDLSEYNGFEHRGETILASEVVSSLAHGLYFEHSHHGDEPAPQTHITLHSAVDRVVSRLEKRFSPWFTMNPDGYDEETSGEWVSPDAIYSTLVHDDPLEWGGGMADVAYAAEAHRQIVVSVVALLLAKVDPQRDSDVEAQTRKAKRHLQITTAEQLDHLSREEAVRVVNETYDAKERLSE